ncbi:N-acetylneuraminate synthase [Lachnospiraceae bacterium YSD2013]|nr:N-acetylneuraminate synthase [Lachnospiraceae bacterium YSD2013]
MSRNSVLIIAEAGVNHNGDINIAKRLVDKAKECNADIVKFQTFNVDRLAAKSAKMAEYQEHNIGASESQKSMLEKLALTQEEFVDLAQYCENKGIKFLSTPFDIESIKFLDKLQDIWKIPSGEITNYPYLVEIAKTRKRVILSTGMSTLDEIDEALAVLRKYGTEEITILHCTTNYPTPMTDVNLRAMETLCNRYKCDVGYSDHTNGIEIPVAAVALGAKVIEKHFTLDRNMEGPDHKASLEPNELAEMVRAIRNVEVAMGDGVKRPTESEKKNIEVARKSIVASKNIKAGELFSEDNITTKRPGTGVSPMRWLEVIGKKAKRDFNEDELIEI